MNKTCCTALPAIFAIAYSTYTHTAKLLRMCGGSYPVPGKTSCKSASSQAQFFHAFPRDFSDLKSVALSATQRHRKATSFFRRLTLFHEAFALESLKNLPFFTMLIM